MILNIRDTVIKEIRSKFPTYKIYDEKKLQGLIRPCFFVDLIPVAIEQVTPNIREYSLFIDVQFMSEKQTKEENLNMVSAFTEMFNSIVFGSFVVNSSNKRFEVVDDILHCLFDLDFTLIGTNSDDSDLMGELVHNKHVNEGGI